LINFLASRSNLADNFLYTGVLTSSNDFNALTVKDGTYVATSTPLHAPSGETGQAIVKVEKQGSFTVQTYQRLNDSRYLWKRTIQDGQTPEAWRDLSLINFSVSRTNLADSFLYIGVLTSSNDLNALTVKDGTYVATSTPINAPVGESGAAIVKVEKQGSFTVQTYQRINDSQYIWKRTIQDGQTPEVWRDLSLINFSVSRSKLADNFLYTGVLTSTDDLDTVQKDGAYVAISLPINAPVGAPAIAHITVAKAGSMVRQTYTDVHDASISWSRNFQTVVIGDVPSIVSDGWMRGSLEIATISKVGGIKVGAGLLVAEDGTLSVTVPTQQNPFAGKKMVCFGDSITEFKNYPDQVRNILGLAEAYNVGFGGCMMSAHNDVAYKEMCMYRLADYIATGNYTGLIDAANDLYTRLSDDNRAIAARLAAIDFNTVDYITIFYGTNDWGNKPGSLGTVAEKTPDGSTFLGSANYVVDRLQTAYPHLKIMFLSPIYRTRLVSGDNKNTDDYTNSSGEVLDLS
jgi:lysophospholipase L1-like esterase